MTKLLNNIKSPKDIKKLSVNELTGLAAEIRELIIATVSKTGGHLASSLGAVELTIALHYSLDLPKDALLWDVGHQCYAHKILTGRAGRFKTLRQLGGLSGFPSKDESEFDLFTVGHSSTSISSALGLACARDIKKEDNKIAAVIGDAALAGGMAFEAMNQAGHMKKDMLVILNDNELSISRTVGALSSYLNRIITNPLYNRIREDLEKFVRKIPKIGTRAARAASKFEEGVKNLLVPGIFFEEMGFRYFGPIDGHNIGLLIARLKDILKMKGPALLHVLTKKGKGYKNAEENPSAYHSAVPFEVDAALTAAPVSKKSSKTFTQAFGEKIAKLARDNAKIVVITAAMPDGTGLNRFASQHKERFFDVGIAEGHAVGFAAGMAKWGFKPVVAVYSTFLQRAYDQIIHDVCLQELGVVFCVDRAGLSGEDGPTHHGVFDISYLRHIPNLTIMAPRDTKELEAMLEFAVSIDKPIAIRYPKGAGPRLRQDFGGQAQPKAPAYAKASEGGRSPQPIEIGKSEILRKGKDLAIIALGSMVGTALEAADELQKEKISAEVINARFAKPLDENLLENLSSRIKNIITVEEGVLSGGFGSAVAEFIETEKIKDVKLVLVGLPDEFIEHGSRQMLLNRYNLSKEGLVNLIKGELL